MTTVPALPVTSTSPGAEPASPGSRQAPPGCERGTIRVAPFSGVKSSSIQTELQTQ